jgi:hypothetical protein
MEDDDAISICGRSSEEETSARSSSLHERRLAKEHRDIRMVGFLSKWSVRLLVALVFFFAYRQIAVGFSIPSFTGGVSLRVVENEETSSFLLPELSGMRYPEHGNMTAVEKVASEYVIRDKSDYDPLAKCSVTSQARIIKKSPQWILQSVDASGNDKTVGGDEFYVTYRDNKRPRNGEDTAVALIKDLADGSYALDFVTTPMDPVAVNLTGRGNLTVHFEYTCNIGRAHQPTKDDWKFGGATLIHHSKSNIQQPPIRAFRFPPSDIDIDLSAFDVVVSFGDSMMQTFVRDRPKPWRYYRKKTNYKENPMLELNSTSLDSLLEKMEEWHGVRHLRNSAIDVAMLLGSSAWDITEHHPNATTTRPHDFSDHLDTCRRFVLQVRAIYPNVTVMWKAPAAMVCTSTADSALVSLRSTIKLYSPNVPVPIHCICSIYIESICNNAERIYAASGDCPIAVIHG